MVKDLDQLERLSIAQHSRYHSSPLCEKEILNTPIEEKDLLNKHECSKPVCYRSNRMTLESIIRNNMKNLNKKLSIYCLTIDQSAWKKIKKKYGIAVTKMGAVVFIMTLIQRRITNH